MDKRCIRKLKTLPQEFCPAAVNRLRWRESLGREPSEQEELSAPGCPWAIRNQEYMFCFFKAFSEDREPLTDAQVAHMLGISELTVRKTRERALHKMANMKEFKEVKEYYPDEVIINERLVDPYEDQLADISHISVDSIDEVSLSTDKDNGET